MLHSECESYKEAFKNMKTLPKQSCERKEARQGLKGIVCNKVFQISHYFLIIVLCDKAEKGVCCSPCALGQVCTPQEDCQSSTEETKRFCDPVKKTVCCKKTSPCDSCDPANGSCLPSLGKCGLAGGEQRIVGGQDALPGEFPFTALLGRKVKLKTRGVVVDKYISPSFVCRNSPERTQQ